MAIPQVFPALSLMYPLLPQLLLHEFFKIQFPELSYPTTSIAWLASSKLEEQFVNSWFKFLLITNCMLAESTPTDTGCLLTASYKAVTLPWGIALKGVLSFIILNGDNSF